MDSSACDATSATAARGEITWHFVSSIERGIKTGTLETLAAIAAALDVTLSELFLDVDRPLPREFNRITTEFAGWSPEVQRAVLRIVEAVLHLATLKRGVPALSCCSRSCWQRRRSRFSGRSEKL